MLSAATAILISALVVVESEQLTAKNGRARLKVFLDCAQGCYEEYLRETVTIVEYVRDRTDADVHVLVTSAPTGSRGLEYTLTFLGQGALTADTRKLTVTTEASDSEDIIRRRLASAITVGLLGYVASAEVPPDLTVEAELAAGALAPGDPASDRWNRWIFSLNGYGSIDAEESTRESEWGLNIGADRVTPMWKISIGSEFNQSQEEFEFDEDEPLSVERRNRSINWLAVRSLGEHWSIGTTGQAESSTFDNTRLNLELAPAIEWNFFPYSMYTRRQLRVGYGAGVARLRYYEITLFDKLEETRAAQELTTTYEQREPWGTLVGSVEWSNYFPGFSTHRIEVESRVNLRIRRGLSFTLEASASRIRDQLSLPKRDATQEEVLLRLRQLSSGFETNLEFGLTYQFGSRFASIVNPRFGQ